MNTFGFNGLGLQQEKIGDITTLTTTEKTNLVGAINEVDAKVDFVFSSIDFKEFGLQWNQTTDAYTRLNDAVGLSVNQTSSPHVSGFSAYYPYSKIQRVNLSASGVVNAVYGDATYKDDGTNGNVMVQIPKFYYKTVYDTTSGNVWQWKISGYKFSGYEVHPAFIDNGIEKDYIYVGAYQAFDNAGTLESKSGVAPTVSQNIGTFRTEAQANGSGWGLFDWTSLSAVQLLYLIEYGSMYAQSVLSVGVANHTSAVASGQTTSLGNGSGEVAFSTTKVVSYRGIENFYGNVWQFIDGIIIEDDGYYIGHSINDYNNTRIGYTKIVTVPIITDGYGTNFEYLNNFKHSFMTNAVGGTFDARITDYLHAHDTAEVNIAVFGGNWDNGASVGAFYLYLSTVASITISFFGARVCYK